MKTRTCTILLLVLAACADPHPPAPPPPVDGRPAWPLLGVFTTLANDHRLAALFDGDEATYWMTPSGAGPGEAIRLFFFPERPAPVRAIAFAAPPVDSLAVVTEMAVFADGRKAGMLSPGQQLPIPAGVSELLLRITEVSRLQTNSRELDDQQLSVSALPAAWPTAMAELRFFDADSLEYRPQLPRWAPVAVEATSSLNPVSAYHPGLLFDGRPWRAWTEGAPGSGSGERLVITFLEPVRITGFAAWNGRQALAFDFRDFPRVRELTLARADTGKWQVRLSDTPAVRLYSIEPWWEGARLSCEVTDVFPGARHRDLVLGELLFLEGEQPLQLVDGLDHRFREEHRASVAGGPLSSWLDRRILNVVASAEAGDHYRRTSFLVRSDGSFYGYTEEWSAVDYAVFESEVRGNWQLLDNEPALSRLRVQGVRTNFALPPADSARQLTFTDYLIIDDKQISGERYLDRYYLY